MRLSRIEASGFRNLAEPIEFSFPLSVLVGPNNVGKSNAIDALRMVLTPLTGWPPRPRRDDFTIDASGNPVTQELSITVHFEDLTTEQSGRMLTALNGSKDRAAICLSCSFPDLGQPRTRFLAGESMSPDIEDWARSAVTYTYLPPLRNAVDDLRPGPNNRLVDLVSALAGDGPDRQQILDIATSANVQLSTVDALINARGGIQDRLDAISGVQRAQHAQLLFTDPAFERVLSNLGTQVDDGIPVSMIRNGLGMNNVLYMAVLLASLAQGYESELHILLVEEPEAHLHPQMQELLMRFLQQEVSQRRNLQVMVTTHSPNLTSTAPVERITSLVRSPSGTVARLIQTFGLKQDELDHLARFLDVTKAGMLFASSVLFVEGVTEQLLLPLLAERLEPPVSLAEENITVVNVGGLAFGPFAALYEEGRLPSRCAIISDSDPPDLQEQQEDGAEEGEPDPVLSATAERLIASQNEQRKVFLSTVTFEHDLVMAGNWEWALQALALIKPRVAKRLKEGEWSSVEDQAQALVNAVTGVKGRFAQALTRTAETVSDEGHTIAVPPYIRDAIRWLAQTEGASTQ